MSQHKHYKLLKQYAKDAKKTDKPWELYQMDTGVLILPIDCESTWFLNIGIMERLENADEILHPPKEPERIPVDMTVLLNTPIVCAFTTNSGDRYSNGFLSQIDITRDSMYSANGLDWDHCIPIGHWHSFHNFHNIDKTIEKLNEAGFSLKVESTLLVTEAFCIVGIKKTHTMPTYPAHMTSAELRAIILG